jgi:putative flippase GtrA
MCKIRRGIAYGIAGSIATAIHYFGLYFLHEVLSVNVVTATCLAFILASGFSYVAQSQFVFLKKTEAKNYAKFIVVALIGLLLNACFMTLGVIVIEIDYRSMFLASTLLIPILTYIINKRFVFNG